MLLDNNHWDLPAWKQRMTTYQWKQLLLKGDEKIIFHGEIVYFKVTNLGYGIVEICKDLKK